MPFSTVWESLKAYLRGQIISYCANKKRRSYERLRLLADEILLVDREYSHSPSPDLVKKRMSLQTEFNTLSTQQAEYLISKSRHGYYEHGEKAGRLLAHQLRQRSVTQNIPAIINAQTMRKLTHVLVSSTSHCTLLNHPLISLIWRPSLKV